MNRQEIVCDYIQTHYVDEGRLRHDVISNKVQINDRMSRADTLNDEMIFRVIYTKNHLLREIFGKISTH